MKTLAFRRFGVITLMALMYCVSAYAQISVPKDASPIEWKDRYVTLADGHQLNKSTAVSPDQAYTAIVWEDYRNGEADVYAQLIDNLHGVARWIYPFVGYDGDNNGVAVCTQSGDQLNPVVAFDSLGGVIVAWEDYRNGVSEIWANRILVSTGQRDPVWGGSASGVRITNYSQTSGAASQVRIAGAPDGAYVVWVDDRAGNLDIYVQYMLSTTAAPLTSWPTNGAPAVNTAYNEQNPDIAPDNSYSYYQSAVHTGIYMVYEKNLGTRRNIRGGQCFADRLFTDRLLETDSLADAGNPKVASTGADNGTIAQGIGAFAAWELYTVNSTRIRANRIPVFGAPVTLCSATGTRGEITIDAKSTFTSYCWVAWSDSRNALSYGKDIYTNAFLMSTGAPLYSSSTAHGICYNVAGDQDQPSLAVCYNPISNGYCTTICWRDLISSVNSDIYQQQITASSLQHVWQANGTQVSAAAGIQSEPHVEKGVIVFEDTRAGNYNVYAQTYGSECNIPTWMGWQAEYAAWLPNVTVVDYDMQTDDDGYAYIAWEQRSPGGDGLSQIYVQKMDPNGVPLWRNGGILVSDSTKQCQDPAVSFDGAGGCFVAWEIPGDMGTFSAKYNHVTSTQGLLSSSGADIGTGADLSNPDLAWRSVGARGVRAYCAVHEGAFQEAIVYEIDIAGSLSLFGSYGSSDPMYGPIIDHAPNGTEFVLGSVDAGGQLWVQTGANVLLPPVAIGLAAVNNEFDICSDHLNGDGFIIGADGGNHLSVIKFDPTAAVTAQTVMQFAGSIADMYHPSISQGVEMSDRGAVAVWSYQPNPVLTEYEVRTNRMVLRGGAFVPFWNNGNATEGEGAVINETTIAPPNTDIIGLGAATPEPTSMVAWDYSAGGGYGSAVKIQHVEYIVNPYNVPPAYNSLPPYVYRLSKGGEPINRMVSYTVNQTRPVLKQGLGETGALFFMDDRTGVGSIFGTVAYSDGAGEFRIVKEGIKERHVVPNFNMSECYPNPVSLTSGAMVTFRFSLANDANVSLKLYNMLGECVATLVQQDLTVGQYTVPFNLYTAQKQLRSGTYFYTLTVGNNTETKKLTIID